MSIKDSTIDQTLLLKIRAMFPDYELAVLTEINLRGPKSVTKLTMVFRWQYCHGLPIKQTLVMIYNSVSSISSIYPGLLL